MGVLDTLKVHSWCRNHWTWTKSSSSGRGGGVKHQYFYFFSLQGKTNLLNYLKIKLVFRFKIFLMLLRVPVIALNILFFVLILHLSQECGNLSCYVILKQAFKLNIVIVKLQFPLYIGLLHHGYKLSADAKLGNYSNLLKLFIFFLINILWNV